MHLGSTKNILFICAQNSTLVDHDFAQDDIEKAAPTIGDAGSLDVDVPTFHRLRAIKVKSLNAKLKRSSEVKSLFWNPTGNVINKF